MALAVVGFTHDQITAAMSNNLVQGGDLHSALDWLCLNLPDSMYWLRYLYYILLHLIHIHDRESSSHWSTHCHVPGVNFANYQARTRVFTKVVNAHDK